MNSYIISAPNIEDAYKKALEMACELTGNREKVMNGCHPDVKTIRREKTELTVDKVREVISDAYILPNESPCKVYIFYDGQYMNISAQNAALKLLEEPPSFVVLILLASNASVFLPTIRSRCAEISINSEYADDESGTVFAKDILALFAKGDAVALYRYCEENNKLSILELRSCLEALRSRISDVLCRRAENPGLTVEKLLELNDFTEKLLKYSKANVNTKQIFGMIEVFSL